MKISPQYIDEIAIKRQTETISDGKDLLKWTLAWWSLCALISLAGLFINGFVFSTFILIAISIFLVRIGNMLCEVSVNIRTTIRQNDDIRLLLLSISSREDGNS